MSGLNECDYPSIGDEHIGLGSLQEISQCKRVPLPAELVERFACIFCCSLNSPANDFYPHIELCSLALYEITLCLLPLSQLRHTQLVGC